MSVHIANMRDAIQDGTVPGKFNEDRTTFEFPTLAYSGARGATHLWTIRIRLLHETDYVAIDDEMLNQPATALPDHKAEITVEAQQVGGKVRDIVPTYVSVGKNLGKKNATNAISQAIRNALGLYNKQKKRGDIVSTPDETKADEPEFDSMPPPMLVQKIGNTRAATLTPEDFARGVTGQWKLNGVRFVAFARNGANRVLVRYSRTGTLYPGQEQIVVELLPITNTVPITPGSFGVPTDDGSEKTHKILAAYGALPDSKDNDPMPYFDGELYYHGKSLRWINGQARREDDDAQLEYRIFDVFFPHAIAAGHDMKSRDRQAYIDAVFAANDGIKHPHVLRVENHKVNSMEEANELSRQAQSEGYEGLILRKDDAGYRYSYNGYHSSNLVKLKPKFDDEFPVVGYAQGTRGKDVGAVIWECEVPNPVKASDARFTVVPKDISYKDRYSIYKCLGELVDGPDGKQITRFERDIKGLPLTVEYAELSTKTGKPLQAKALAFRTYEGGPDIDPVKKMLNDCTTK